MIANYSKTGNKPFMFKIILLGALIYFIWRVLAKSYSKPTQKNSELKRKEFATEMIQCSKCGAYIDKNSATCMFGKWRCSPKCS